jgi:hypothetical protein
MILFQVKLESDQLGRFFLTSFNKNPGEMIYLRMLDSSIFIEQELIKLIGILKQQTIEIQFRV